MIEVEGQLKKVGNSVALLVPKKVLVEGKFKAGQTVRAFIGRKKNPLKGLFGSMQFARSTEEILKDVDKEGWDG